MDSPVAQERPYRSHLRPACLPCRRRKSRCKIEPHTPSCLMCRVHGTECHFPAESRTSPSEHGLHSPARPRRPARRASRPTSSSRAPDTARSSEANAPIVTTDARAAQPTRLCPTWGAEGSGADDTQSSPLSIDEVDGENPHIIGPAVTNDSQVLTDYLSAVNENHGGMRLIRPKPMSGSTPVLFTSVQKRPLGLTVSSSPSYIKCEIIEKLLEPWLEHLLELYFHKTNACLPLLDRDSFKAQYRDEKERISPSFLSCLYAHSLVYWRFDPQLSGIRPPDGRFIWNLANEALYSELHLSPGISTITAILLNTGGRPTTSLVGNGVQLGSAVSLAHSLGLNHNPLSWDIPYSKKLQRMQVWWSSRRSSLAYGTPPHLQTAFYDVPQPKKEYFSRDSECQRDLSAISVFVALSELTNVLDQYLQYLYQIDRRAANSTRNLELSLNRWVEGLEGDVRWVITRGTRLDLPGAANLRLAYLSVQLLTHRLQLEEDRTRGNIDEDVLANRYIHVRRTAEDIVVLVLELGEQQLGDFWLPMSAFIFPSTVTFLLRCALETEKSPSGLAQSTSLKLAWDLITGLRRHRESSSWDLGDICLAQHAELVEKLMSPARDGLDRPMVPDHQDIMIPDASFIDELFPSLWGTFQAA
ncbi:fungal-specific transcription factor domain-containing protein [Xylariomycetidae sp. FL2044]|nr:fungal-specific transcription factor domain-containing protein [Xylariomycetidae sp. FL2044]